jgi:hypothetical protein
VSLPSRLSRLSRSSSAHLTLTRCNATALGAPSRLPSPLALSFLIRLRSNPRSYPNSSHFTLAITILILTPIPFLYDSIGTTKKGIGPAYSGKASRSGLRVHHLFDAQTFEAKFRKLVEGRFKRYGWFEYDTEGEIVRYRVRTYRPFLFLSRSHLILFYFFPFFSNWQELANRLRPYVLDTLAFLHNSLSSGKRVLVEGANALMLDLDWGTYPYVTSSSTSIGGTCTGLGIPPKMIGKVVGVVKAYTTRVGGGPFPTELEDVSIRGSFWLYYFIFSWESDLPFLPRKPAHTYKKSATNTAPPPVVVVVVGG